MRKTFLLVLTMAVLFGGVASAEAQWSQWGGDIDGEHADAQAGYSVSVSADGSRVAIGEPHNDDNGDWAGHVRVYEWNGGAWIQMGDDINGEAETDKAGWSISLSADGSRVAIGAPGNNGNGDDSGHVRVYQWSNETSQWQQMGTNINGEAEDDQSGSSVSLSADGSRVAIGAPYNDGNGTDSGHVRMYEWNGGAWTQMGGDIDGEAEYDESGRSVSLSADGSRVAIGAPRNDGNGNDSGHVWIYQWNGEAWTQVGEDIIGEAAYNGSGSSVSLRADGSSVAIGAIDNDGHGFHSGHVRVYEWNGVAWTQMGADIDGEAEYDESGRSVSLSADGSRVAIGANWNDGINGDDSGHVRVYQWDGGSWAQLGSDIDGEAEDDFSGYSVSLSADGSRVAIGARHNDGINGNNSGHVRMHHWAAGVCCVAGQACQEIPESACAAMGGVWLGTGVACDPTDCNSNGFSDACDVATGTSADCNANNIPDECDIAGDVSHDCDANGIPDGCEVDTDGDGLIDGCDNCPDDAYKVTPGACGCGVPDIDTDSDGVADCEDNCPGDPDKLDPGACGCSVPDKDADGDGVPDCLDIDLCPDDPDKTIPGACGCGVPDEDADGDGAPDCLDIDLCPDDPGKTVPGTCGCGVPDEDANRDGVPDCLDIDLCPEDPNKTNPGICGCGVPDTDTDGDGIPDCIDNDPATPAGQTTPGPGTSDTNLPRVFLPLVPFSPLPFCGVGLVVSVPLMLVGLAAIKRTRLRKQKCQH